MKHETMHIEIGLAKSCPDPAFRAEAGSGTAPFVPADLAPVLVDGGGPVLTLAQVILIFWGSYWEQADASPSAAEITTAAQMILAGPYMSELAQYRGITNGELYNTVIASADPPQNFSDDDVTGTVTSCIQAGALPAPGDLANVYYAVILPPNVAYETPGIIGKHWSLSVGGQLGAVGFSGNNGVLGNITEAFCHELVESCSDPQLDAFTLENLPVGDEIADACEGQAQVYVNGVKVAQYWSNRLQACVAPTGPQAEQVWHGRWNPGWSQFAPLTLERLPAYLAYTTVNGGGSTIERVNAGAQGVILIWTPQLPADFTSVISLPQQGDSFILCHDAGNRLTEIYRVYVPDTPAPRLVLLWRSELDAGYTVLMPFQLGSTAYFLASAADGLISVNRLNQRGAGVTSSYASRSAPGWTHLASFTLDDQPAYLAYQARTGRVAIGRINADGSLPAPDWTGAISSRFTSIEPFTLGSRQYFLCYYAPDGYARIYLLLPAPSLQLAWWGHWTPGWTSIASSDLAGQARHLLYNSTDGAAEIVTYQGDPAGA